MKKRTWTSIGLVAVTITGLAVAAALWQRPPARLRVSETLERHSPAERSDARDSGTMTSADSSVVGAVVAPSAVRGGVKERDIPAGNRVHISAEQVLATVNDVVLTLKDLMPVAEEPTQRSMTREMYDSLLERAIERELTFQAAEALGVDLTPGQKLRLEQIRIGMGLKETSQFYSSSEDSAKIDFAVRDFAGVMLQNSIMEKYGLSPAVTEGHIQQYYQNHVSEYGALPANPVEQAKAWRVMSAQIRERLAPLVRADYQRRLGEYLGQLKASWHVSVGSQ